ncbi:zinc finger protein 33B-like [Aphidius gifuensis]|uniref:zinc finger protein 33B-like n=1 Tax=Aphidius gifuensis TaxID=684658 RepID=UPI001CDD6791|nr:zinc finger protein 33B-like [Aphidius gifuensis]
MNFLENNSIQGLPQFSELTSRSNSLTNSIYSVNTSQIVAPSSTVYTTTGLDQTKQTLLTNGATKYSSPLVWPSPNALMQLCDKQSLQALNIPTYSQNNIITVQQNNLPVRILPNTYLPTTSSSQTETIIIKQEDNIHINNDNNINNQNNESHINLHDSSTMTEYLQKLQATSLPLTLHQILKLSEKRDKIDDNIRPELLQNNILNIPNVAGFRNTNLISNNYLNDQLMNDINPSDLNIHMETPDGNENISTQTQIIKIEQQQQQQQPKTEKKRNFKAKCGEIKISIAADGAVLYYCPECNLACYEKTEIEEHIQGHVRERKYQCKECGAMLKRKEHLDQHMRGHSDERPFKCPVCSKAFKRNEHLTRHYVIHSGDKNFTCSVCQKAFSRKDHLNKHTQTHLGIKKSKIKKDININITDNIKDNNITEIVNDIPKFELSYILKDGNIAKQDTTFFQHLQSIQKDQSIMNTVLFKEQLMKDGSHHQQQAVNMNEILPQNTRYLMPS